MCIRDRAASAKGTSLRIAEAGICWDLLEIFAILFRFNLIFSLKSFTKIVIFFIFVDVLNKIT